MSRAAKSIIIIAGPTAAGKTEAAIWLAKNYNTEIISADSRQCYKELSIGVARPSKAELEEVPHHFIASHSIHENITAAYFENYALQKLEDLFREHDHVIITGGTGLYLKALCEGLDDIPEVPAELRSTLQADYDEKGLAWLKNELERSDPKYAETGELKNPHRMLRALEVWKHTGHSILDFRSGVATERNFSVKKIAIDLPRAVLYERINQRVDKMMEAGLEDEVKRLEPFKHLKALQTVGYAELFDYFDGKISLDDAVALIKQHTRNYAKRQLTWFKKEDYTWITKEELMKK